MKFFSSTSDLTGYSGKKIESTKGTGYSDVWALCSVVTLEFLDFLRLWRPLLDARTNFRMKDEFSFCGLGKF